MFAALLLASCIAIGSLRAQDPPATGAVASPEVERGVIVRDTSGAARRTSLPCRMTFAEGETKAPESTHHLEDRGAPLPAEWRAITRWRDGSIRDASAIVPLDLEAGGTRILRLALGPGPSAPPLDLESRILARLPAMREQSPWFDLVSEVEDHEGTIHRARLRLDATWSSPHHGAAIQAFRFRDHHRGSGSKLERDFLTLTGWLEIRSRDSELSLDLQLGNDYLGVAKELGQLDPEAFPWGSAVRFRRWTLRVRNWSAAPVFGTELGVAAPRTDLGWICFDLLKPLTRDAEDAEKFYVLADGQTLVRRFLLSPAEPGEEWIATNARRADLVKHAAKPLVARPLLPGLRLSGAYGLLGEIGPASLELLSLARVRAEARRAVLADAAQIGPFGGFAVRSRGTDPASGSYAPLLSWYHGVDADFEWAELSQYQLAALRPVHMFGVDAFAHAQWRGDLSLGRPVNQARFAAWRVPGAPPTGGWNGREAASFAPSDEIAEIYLATLRPYLLDQLRFHLHRVVAASRVPFTTSTRHESELLRAAVLAERIAPDARARKAILERWKNLVLPGMAALGDRSQGPFYVLAQEPSPFTWGPDIYWDSPSEAGLFAAAAIAAWREWGDEALLEGALSAGLFIASAWLPRPDGKGHGFARELPLFLQDRGVKVPLLRDWYLGEEPIAWEQGGQAIRTTRRARLRVQIDDFALRCESPLLLLAEIGAVLERGPGIPVLLWAQLPPKWAEIWRALHDAAPADSPGGKYSIGCDPWRQVARHRETRDRLEATVVPSSNAPR